MEKNNLKTKSIFVGICGKPNAGKSTILNFFLGEKLSIVTPKPQTTRNSIRGILTEADTQVVFIDTPGIFKPKDDLQKTIVKNAWNGLVDLDLVIFVHDAEYEWTRSSDELAKSIKERSKKLICALNKTDRNRNYGKNYLVADEVYQSGCFEEIFPISAKNGDGMENLKKYIFENAKNSVWHYGEDDLTDKSNIFIASEITRETAFILLSQELPYSVNIETPIFKFHQDRIEIKQDIVILRESHKAILIGEHGSMIKRIRIESTEKLKDFFQMNVDLELFVKVRENWRKDIKID